jgi:hypothetical protein
MLKKLFIIIIALGLSGCKKSVDRHATEPKINFAVAGTTQSAAKDFLARLQSAVTKNNKQDIAKLTQFPLRINQHGKSSFVKSKAEFIANYPTIFTKKIKQVIAKQQLQNLFVNSQGVMLGNGEVWARPADPAKSQALKVIVINH